MKNSGKHFNLNQRKLLMSGLAKGLSAQAISEFLFCDPSSVPKEVKRNRKLVKDNKKLSQQQNYSFIDQ